MKKEIYICDLCTKEFDFYKRKTEVHKNIDYANRDSLFFKFFNKFNLLFNYFPNSKFINHICNTCSDDIQNYILGKIKK